MKKLTQVEAEEMSDFSEEFYAVHADKLRRVVRLKHRLYSEKKMNGDEMRDWAHILGLLLEDALRAPLHEGDI